MGGDVMLKLVDVVPNKFAIQESSSSQGAVLAPASSDDISVLFTTSYQAWGLQITSLF